MNQKSTFVGLVAILSLTMALGPILIDDVSALKSEGVPSHRTAPETNHIVCGGILCVDVIDDSVREVQGKL